MNGNISWPTGRLFSASGSPVKSLMLKPCAGTGAQRAPLEGTSGLARDGSTVLMPDTPANQEAYPQHPNQAAGRDFPITRLMVLFCLSCGAACNLLLAPWRTSKVALARQLYPHLQPSDIFVADSYFYSYGDIFCFQNRKWMSSYTSTPVGKWTSAGERAWARRTTWWSGSGPAGVQTAFPEKLSCAVGHLSCSRRVTLLSQRWPEGKTTPRYPYLCRSSR